MSDVLFTLAQFIMIIWPLFILTALIYTLQMGMAPRKRSRRARKVKARLGSLAERTRHNLLITWTILFIIWVVTMFAPTNTPSLIPEPWNTLIFLGGFALLWLVQAARVGMFRSRVIARVDLHRAQAIDDLKRMDPYEFEGLITETYRAYGYNVQHVGESGDHGIDIEMHAPDGEHWIVQCKRYHDSVGESIIRDLYGSMISDDADHAVLVTTAEITPPAREWAQGKPIDLVDGVALLDLIRGARERTEGTWFDRLAHWMSHVFVPGALPGANASPEPVLNETRARLEPAADAAPVLKTAARTQPVRVSPAQSNGRIHYAHGVPVCPNCGLPMLARPPRPGDPPGRLLYRCPNYPTCRVVLEHQR